MCFALFFLLYGAPLSASIVVHYELEQMVSEAHGIVHGQIESQRAAWRGQQIITTVTVRVFECLKGPYQPGELIVIEQLGGRVDNLATIVAGAPVFITGEEVVLFLEPGLDPDRSLVLGMAQGKFTVQRGADGDAAGADRGVACSRRRRDRGRV